MRSALPLAAGVLLVSMVAHFRVPLLPAIGAELQMSATQLGMIATAFAVGRLAVDMPIGRLADRVEPLRLLSLASLVLAAGSLAMALAPSASWMLAASVVIGVASATGNTTGMTALSGSAPPARRGSAMALFSGALLAGQALGPSASGGVAGLGTWRTAAFVASGLGVVVAVLATAWHSGSLHRAIERVLPEGDGSDVVELTPVQRGALYSVGFSVFFTQGAMPLTLVPLVGAADYDLSVGTIGVGLGVGGLARILGAVAAGQLSDRVSRRAALLPALVLQAVGVALLAVAGTGWWLAAIVTMSLGSSGNGVGATILGDRTNRARLGRTFGRYRFAGDIGLLVGPTAAAFAYDVAGRGAAVALVTGVLAVCAASAAAVLPETHAPRRDGRAAEASAGVDVP